MRTALIDGDELAYKISSKYQTNYYGVYKDDRLLYRCRSREDAIESIENQDDLTIQIITEVRRPDGFERKIDEFIDTIIDNTNSDKFEICISGNNNFRYALAKLLPYKGNREGVIKPGYYLEFREYLLNKYNTYQEDHLEADDLLTNRGYLNKNTVICSTDKDLRTVPSYNYNISTRYSQRISKSIALYNFYYQLLIGDSTDNIPSPYNLGEKTAIKILEEVTPYSQDEREYISVIIPHYFKFLSYKNKEGEYRTKWYREQNIKDILWEIGNLLWMHRTLDPEERWELPEPYEEVSGKEEIESKEEGELELLESITSEGIMEK